MTGEAAAVTGHTRGRATTATATDTDTDTDTAGTVPWTVLLCAQPPPDILTRFVQAVLDDPRLPPPAETTLERLLVPWTIRAGKAPHTDVIVTTDGRTRDVRIWLAGYASRLLLAGADDTLLDQLATRALTGGDDPLTAEQAHLLTVLLTDAVDNNEVAAFADLIAVTPRLCPDPDPPLTPRDTTPPRPGVDVSAGTTPAPSAP